MQPMKKRLGEILRERGVVDGMQLQSALAYQRKWGVPLGRGVVDLRFCSDGDVLEALALQAGVPALDLDAELLDPALGGLVPRKLAEAHRVVPLKVDGPRDMVLEVAIAAPANLQSLDAVRSVTRKARVVPRLATDAAISRALERLYPAAVEAPRRPEPILLPEADEALGLELEEAVEHFHLPDVDETLDVALGDALEDAVRHFQLPERPETPRARTATWRHHLPDLSERQEVLELPLLEPLDIENLARLLELTEVPAGAGEVLLYGWGAAATRGLMQTLGAAGLHASVASTQQVLEAEEGAVVLAPIPSLEALVERPRARLLAAGKVPERDVGRAQALGARGFLVAPLDPELTLRAVRRLVGAEPPARAAC